MELADDARIAFICAMPMELTPLVEKLSLAEMQVGDVTVHSGTLDGREVVAIVTGMGVDYATTGTGRLLDAIPSITSWWWASPARWRTRRRSAHSSSRRSSCTAPPARSTGPHRWARGAAGKMLTSVGLTTDPGVMDELRAQGVVSLDMETAAIAHLCDERGIPWSVFRVISDRPDSGITEELFQTSNMDGTPNQDAIDAYFAKHPGAMEALAHLAEDAILAADAAAEAAIRAFSSR